MVGCSEPEGGGSGWQWVAVGGSGWHWVAVNGRQQGGGVWSRDWMATCTSLGSMRMAANSCGRQWDGPTMQCNRFLSPLQLTFMLKSKLSASATSMAPPCSTPAEFTSTSTGPNVLTVAATPCLMASASVTSAAKHDAGGECVSE